MHELERIWQAGVNLPVSYSTLRESELVGYERVMFHQIERGRLTECCSLWELDRRTEIRLVHSYIDWIAIAVDLIYLNRRRHVLKRR